MSDLQAKLSKVISADVVYKDLNKVFSKGTPFVLAGGAVVDFYRTAVAKCDRTYTPKDYDLALLEPSGTKEISKALVERATQVLRGNDWCVSHASRTAITFTKEINCITYEVQILTHRTVQEFTFKAQQSYITLGKSPKLTLNVDLVKGNLTPTSFTKPKVLVDALRLLPKYQGKGLTMHPITYNSVLSEVLNLSSKQVKSTDFRSSIES